MADTFTPNYNLTQPEVGSSGDSWGGKINTDLSILDSTIKTVSDATTSKSTAAMSAEDNLLINGDFRIAQRGTSFGPPAGTDLRIMDRWVVHCGTGSTVAVAQTATGPGSAVGAVGELIGYFCAVQRTGSTDATIYQLIEDVNTASGQTITLSFWTWATVAGLYYCAFQQIFGSGGSPVVTGSANYSINAPSTWERKTISMTIPSIAGKTAGAGHCFNLFWGLPGGIGNATWYLANIDARLGTVAPAQFLRRPSQQELALCQRYFQSRAGWATVLYGPTGIYAEGPP